MANKTPNTSGLKPFNKRPRSESAEIQSAGGLASGVKKRELKHIKDIIRGVRADYDIDPIELSIIKMFNILNNSQATVSDIIKALDFISKNTDPEITFYQEPPKDDTKLIEELYDKIMSQRLGGTGL